MDNNDFLKDACIPGLPPAQLVAKSGFDAVWPRLPIPGEFDAMDDCDQARWISVIKQAYLAGLKDASKSDRE